MPDLTDLLNKVHNLDCFDLLRCIPDGTIDAIITDLPYGQVACNWDTVIPFAPMWTEVKRVLKPRGVFVTTASQPFTSALVMSNPSWFRCEWIWEKNFGSNFLNTDQYPMKEHENVLVFAEGAHCYNPQPTARNPNGASRARYGVNPTSDKRSFVGGFSETFVRIMDIGSRVPRSIIYAICERGQHPTQKPLSLFEYLIKTYTQPNEIVLDFACGSGTTAVACRNIGRRFIAGDQSAEYCAIARDRLRMPFEPREHVKESAPLSDLPLFAAIGD